MEAMDPLQEGEGAPCLLGENAPNCQPEFEHAVVDNTSRGPTIRAARCVDVAQWGKQGWTKLQKIMPRRIQPIPLVQEFMGYAPPPLGGPDPGGPE